MVDRLAKFAKPPAGSRCEEANSQSRERYIPCNAPAVVIVKHERERPLFMCLACADHNVKNRGASYVPVVDQDKAISERARNAQGVKEQVEEYIPEAAPGPSQEKLARAIALGNDQVRLRREIAAIEAQLDAKNKALKTNAEADLPQAMSEAGIEALTLDGGIGVSIKKVVRASIPKTDPEPGLDFVDEVAPDLVTRTLKIVFDRSEEKFFRKFMRDLNQRKKKPKLTYERTVPHQTLSKFVRTRDKEGLGVPEKALGVYRVTTAVVSLPEDKARKDELPE